MEEVEQEEDLDQALIFVSIASYRDPETPWTVRSALERARHPNRLVFGICWQIDAESDRPLLEAMPVERRPGQIRHLILSHRDAGGPAYARALIQDRLYAGERFYLQIDAHTMFRTDFDLDLIRQWTSARRLYRSPILTTYPPGYDGDGPGSQAQADAVFATDPGPIRLQALEFHASDGRLRLVGRPLPPAAGPVRHAFWAAGFSFSDGAIVADCPYDARLFGTFFGEESSMGARLWTSGYEFVVPMQTVLVTKWSRSGRPTFRELSSSPDRERRARIAAHRLDLVLGGRAQPTTCDDDERAVAARQLDRFGLGSVRTLDDYERFAGIRFATRSMATREPRVGPADLIAAHLGESAV